MHEDVYIQENKGAVVWPRRLLQYCQLYKKFRDISRLIVFLLNFKIFMFSKIPRGTVAWKQWTRLWAGRSGVSIPARSMGFSLLESIQTRHAAHPTSCSMDTGGFPGGKAAGASS